MGSGIILQVIIISSTLGSVFTITQSAVTLLTMFFYLSNNVICYLVYLDT